MKRIRASSWNIAKVSSYQVKLWRKKENLSSFHVHNWEILKIQFYDVIHLESLCLESLHLEPCTLGNNKQDVAKQPHAKV